MNVLCVLVEGLPVSTILGGEDDMFPLLEQEDMRGARLQGIKHS